MADTCFLVEAIDEFSNGGDNVCVVCQVQPPLVTLTNWEEVALEQEGETRSQALPRRTPQKTIFSPSGDGIVSGSASSFEQMLNMSQSFFSIRERFETTVSQNQTGTSGKFQSSTATRSYVQAANAIIRVPAVPCPVAFPEKNPPPSPVRSQVSSITTRNRDERSEKVRSFSELIKEQSRSLRVPPEVPQKPNKDQRAISNSAQRPTTSPKPPHSLRLQSRPRSPISSTKIPPQSSPQRTQSVNCLRQHFEAAPVAVPVGKPVKVSTINARRFVAQRERVPQIAEIHTSSRELSSTRAQQTAFPNNYSPAIENLYDDPVFHGKPPTAQTNSTSELRKSDDEELYANLPNHRLKTLDLTIATSGKTSVPLPPRTPVYENFASHERRICESNTLPRHFKSISFENLIGRESQVQQPPNDASSSSYDSDFDDDDEEFGEVSASHVQGDERILGKHFALNHARDRTLSTLLYAPRQRFSYAAPQIRPELKTSMSFSQKSHERSLIRNRDTPDGSEKYDKKLQNIADELISTEKVFVDSLTRDYEKFNEMFKRRDLPRGLTDKQGILFGNIDEIIRFHRDTVLPMFETHQKDLNSLFDQFSVLLDDNRFYEYVIFATNNKNALSIVDDFQPYFQHFQTQINDPLGIQSFLLLPIQRLPRYELFLKDFKKALFEACSHSSKYFTQKSQVKALCDLEKKMKNLLSLVNEANVVCDIVGWTTLNLFNRENRFRKVLDDLFVYDYDLQQGYGGKVFIFDKFMIYTEVRGDYLIYRGCYDASRGIDLIAEEKAFKMAHRRVQVCNFHSETATHNQYCLSYIEDMIQSNRMNGYDRRGYGSNTSSGSMSTVHEEDEL